MEDKIEDILRELINQKGIEVLNNGQLLRGYLLDKCSNNYNVVSVIIKAIKLNANAKFYEKVLISNINLNKYCKILSKTSLNTKECEYITYVFAYASNIKYNTNIDENSFSSYINNESKRKFKC